MTRLRQGTLLVGLLVVWGGLLTIRLSADEEPQRLPLKYRGGQANNHAVIAAPSPDRQDALEVQSLANPHATHLPSRPVTNVFAPLRRSGGTQRVGLVRVPRPQSSPGPQPSPPAPPSVPPPPPPVVQPHSPPPPSPEELAAREAARQRELAERQREQTKQQARRALEQYRFLGFVSQDGVQQAFVAKGQEIFIVRIGERLDGQIQVSAINQTGITLRDVSVDVEITLTAKPSGT